MPAVDDELEVFLASLERCSLSAVQDEWRKRWGTPPTLRSVRLMRHLVAWRLQTELYGDLSVVDRRHLKSTATPVIQALREGSRVAREYQGIVYEVVAEARGFRYRDRTYRSLSAIAREITGVRWNGPRFFGLRPGGGRGAS
ncbi:DUF2924 domain-containing protein [Brevundimonas terrae]|uniref:DUF2924 domain-containing protein n=1 Tax=Brevundimonas terrae TaxID=363631 RepID=UPI00141DD9A4|nr:DUF2924 domain-containing protein [Brevundimonas terrae]